MRSGHIGEQAHRAREFEAFTAGAGGRLLHAATLLTAESRADNPCAKALLTATLARTYAVWERLRDDDPYAFARQDLATRFARSAWRYRGREGRGPLAVLSPRERLVLVLRLYEGVAEEQIAALLGLPEPRVRAVCARAVVRLRSGAPAPRAGLLPSRAAA